MDIEITAHLASKETVAIPLPSELGEDEVMVVISFAPRGTLPPEKLIEFLVPRMVHFMVPATFE